MHLSKKVNGYHLKKFDSEYKIPHVFIATCRVTFSMYIMNLLWLGNEEINVLTMYVNLCL